MGPVGQDALQMPFDHLGDSRHRFEHLPGLVTHRPHPRAPVAEQLPGLRHILPFIDALKHQPHRVGHARHTPFQGHRLPLLGFHLSPVHPILGPHPLSPLQPVPLAGVGPALGLPNLVACLHHILDDVEFIVHYLSVPEVVADAIGVGGTNVDGHVLDRLGMPVVT